MSLSGTSIDELKKRQSRLLGIIIAFSILSLLMIVLFFVMKEKKMGYLAPMLGASVTMIPLCQQLQAIRSELKSRAEAEVK